MAKLGSATSMTARGTRKSFRAFLRPCADIGRQGSRRSHRRELGRRAENPVHDIEGHLHRHVRRSPRMVASERAGVPQAPAVAFLRPRGEAVFRRPRQALGRWGGAHQALDKRGVPGQIRRSPEGLLHRRVEPRERLLRNLPRIAEVERVRRLHDPDVRAGRRRQGGPRRQPGHDPRRLLRGRVLTLRPFRMRGEHGWEAIQ